MGEILFVSGIGTGVGKSVATGVLARRALAAGRDAITMKLVQTGNTGFSEDLALHRRIMGVGCFPEDVAGLTAPQIFAYPSSPLLAAQLEGRTVDLDAISAAVRKCAQKRELVFVEGVGGLLVPLTGTMTVADFVAREGWRTILVANGVLGSISHTIATLEAAKSRGIEIVEVVYNWAEGVPAELDADTPVQIAAALERLGYMDAKVTRLGRVDVPPPADEDTNGAAEKLLAYDREHVWHPYASLSNTPPVRLATRSHGVEIETADGRRLIDAVSSWWCAAHGHNRPEIVEAMRRQAATLPHVMFGGFTHEPAVTLAKRLADFAPRSPSGDALDRVFFADSGSIAVEVAVKMSIQYQHAKGRIHRTKMLALKGGYHGDTACAMALSDPDGMHALFSGMMPKHFFADKPAPLGAKVSFDSIRQTVAEHRDEIAGIICEPVLQAANAMNIYSGEYLRELRRLADENDFVLVFDEIATGFYRTGPLWAASGHAGVVPDVMTVGKALTGGHVTLAATLASHRVAETISGGSPSAFMHGPTFMANPVACAAACASLDLFAAGDYETNVKRIETRLRDSLAEASKLPNVLDVRCIGAVGIIEVASLPERRFIDETIDRHGVWLRPFSNFIYTMPPLVSNADTIDRIAAAMLDLASAPPGPPPADPDFHE